MENWTINEEEALKIVNSPISKIPKSNVDSDLNLSEEERIKQAAEILKKWKMHNQGKPNQQQK